MADFDITKKHGGPAVDFVAFRDKNQNGVIDKEDEVVLRRSGFRSFPELEVLGMGNPNGEETMTVGAYLEGDRKK